MLCYVVCEAHKNVICYRYIVNGFEACRVWNNRKRTAKPNVILPSNTTNIGKRASPFEAHSSLFGIGTRLSPK